MKITLSKNQWERIGKQAGWMKKAQDELGYDPETYSPPPITAKDIIKSEIRRNPSIKEEDLLDHILNCFDQANPEQMRQLISDELKRFRRSPLSNI